MQQSQLQLISFEVMKVLFQRDTYEKGFQFEVNLTYDIIEVTDNSFKTSYIIKLQNTDKNSNPSLQMEVIGDFKTIGDTTPEILESFKRVNAPSILYPYIRAFITNFTAQVGLKPVILPVNNFTITSNS